LSDLCHASVRITMSKKRTVQKAGPREVLAMVPESMAVNEACFAAVVISRRMRVDDSRPVDSRCPRPEMRRVDTRMSAAQNITTATHSSPLVSFRNSALPTAILLGRKVTKPEKTMAANPSKEALRGTLSMEK